MPSTTPILAVAFVSIDPPSESFLFPHSPTSVGETIQVDWARAQPLHFSSQSLSYRGTQSRVLDLPEITPWAETQDESRELERTIARFKSFGYSSATRTQVGGDNRPPRFLIDWPNMLQIVVVLTQISVVRTQFFSDGSPRRWRIRGQYVEWMDGRCTREDVVAGRDGWARAQGRVR